MDDIPDDRCPDCGAIRPDGLPPGDCPRCLDRAGLVQAAPGVADEGPPEGTCAMRSWANGESILSTLGATIGPVPRVLLRDTEPLSGPGPVVRPSSPEMPDVGDRSARLQLLGEIARGGMGAIMKGRDLDLGRDLAVKVLLEKHQDKPEMVRRFVEEAQIAGQLQHPGVVPVYELGAFADLRPYFAMKLVKGRTLAELLADRDGPADGLPRLLGIFEQVGQTLAYAHARGVIHRDLKPSNIMVGGFGEVQVMDWGLAKVLPRGGATDDAGAGKVVDHETIIATSRDESDPGLSIAGSAMGTPAYMAPEQARGEVDRLDERSDDFAMGSILVEILTGEPAFTGRSTGEILRKSCRGDVSEALTRLVGRAVDGELAGLARDCLAPEPEDRPRNAAILAERLTGYLSAVQERAHRAELGRAAESARAEEAVAKARAERRARRMTGALAATVLATAAVAGGAFAWSARQRQERLGRVRDVLLVVGTRLREAEGDTKGDPLKWQDARAAADQAAEALRAAADAASSTALADLRARIEAGSARSGKVRDLIKRLEATRGRRVDSWDLKQADKEYTQAFRDFGIDAESADPKVAGAELARTGWAVEIAGALDDWALDRRKRDGVEDVARSLLIVAIARVSDPDSWRDALRARFGRWEPKSLLDMAGPAKLAAQPPASLVLLAIAFRDSGRVPEAIDVLRAAWRRDPGDFWVNYELGMNLYTLPKHDAESRADAVRFLTAAVACRPCSYAAHHNLGIVLNGMGKHDAAIAQMREALRLKPDDWLAHANLGAFIGDKGEVDAGIAQIREAIRLRPEAAIPHYYLGPLIRKKGDLDGAIAELRDSIRLDPGLWSAHRLLGLSLAAKGDAAVAVASVREAIRLDSAEVYAFTYPGLAFDKPDERKLAIAFLREATRAMPEIPEAHAALGLALKYGGELDAATVAFREAIRLKPDMPSALANLGHVLYLRGKLDEAIPFLRRALKTNPNDFYEHYILGQILKTKGDRGEAIAEYREAARLEGDKIGDAIFHLGDLLVEAGKAKEAIEVFRRIAAVKPDDPRSKKALGRALRLAGDLDGAITAFRDAAKLKADDFDNLYHLGNALRDRGRPQEAVDEIRRGVALAPDSPIGRYYLGLALEAVGDLDGAIAAHREAARLDGESAGEAIYKLGDGLLAAGRSAQAIDVYRRADRLKPGDGRGLKGVGMTLIQRGDFRGAIGPLRAAARLLDSDARLHQTLGWILLDTGDFDGALVALYKARALAGADEGLRRQVEGLLAVADRRLSLEGKYRAVIGGEARPKDAQEGVDLALMAYARTRYAASARLFADAFAADPKLADFPGGYHRYNAACSAGLAVSGIKTDDPRPDDASLSQIRGHALAWLRDDLASLAKGADPGTPQSRASLRITLDHWKADPDLAAFRDHDALAKLPEPERKAWQDIWADVDTLIRTVNGPGIHP